MAKKKSRKLLIGIVLVLIFGAGAYSAEALAQAMAEQAVARLMDNEGGRIGASQAALVAMTPDGAIRAMVGGTDFDITPFNRATQAQRQPGSSFKPIVYAAALDNGYTPASVVLDAPLEIKQSNGEIWKPKNYEKDFFGPSTLRRGHRCQGGLRSDDYDAGVRGAHSSWIP